MFVTSLTRRNTRLGNIVFLILFLGIIGLLAWLSTRYSIEADWTASGRNTLSEASTALLAKLEAPITITSYATEDGSVRQAVQELIHKYQRHKKNLDLKFINPDLEPDTVRTLGISINGELVITYQGRSENLKTLSEQALTNSLQRLARGGERWLVFLQGHAERKPQGVANHDLGQWGQNLARKGFKIQSHNLVKDPQLPANTQVLIIASPQIDLLSGEVAIIKQYVDNGGNILWLSDPSADDLQNTNLHGLSGLAKQLGFGFHPGTIVDPTTQTLGVSDPRFALVADYPDHSITRNIDSLSLFPQSHGLTTTPTTDWLSHRLLQTETRSWSETDKLIGTLQFDPAKDINGPLTLGIALTRPKPRSKPSSNSPPPQQRIVVIGDGDFLANAYLGNGANLSLGMNVMNWLAHDDTLIDIPARISRDRQLTLSPVAQGVIGFGFLFVLPLVLGGSGFLIWWKRRKR